MTTKTTDILAHGIGGGGYDLRHRGCAPKCCERDAVVVGDPEPECGFASADERDAPCGGCGARLIDPPAPMDFDRDAPCEEHAAEPVTCPTGCETTVAESYLGALGSVTYLRCRYCGIDFAL